MTTGQQALRQRLLVAMRTEASERLERIDKIMLSLDTEPENDAVEQIFREVHSLKGAARAVSLPGIESLCHSWESLFTMLRRQAASLTSSHQQLCQQASHLLRQMLQNLDAPPPAQLKALCQQLEQAHAGDAAAVATTEPEPLPAPVEAKQGLPAAENTIEDHSASTTEHRETSSPTQPPLPGDHLNQEEYQFWQERLQQLRQPPHYDHPDDAPVQWMKVNTKHFAGLLKVADGLQQNKLDILQLGQEMQALQQELYLCHRHGQDIPNLLKQWRHTLPAQEHLHSSQPSATAELFENMRISWSNWEYQLGRLGQKVQQLERSVSSMSELMQQELQAILILPCTAVLDGLAAMVQELAEATGKQVKLQLSGSELNVDKRVLDGIRTPILHLLRNAIDHGIESPQHRQNLGKTPQGHLHLHFSQEHAGRFELKIEDDGAGMDAEAIQRKALAMGLIDQEGRAALSEEALYQLAFQSGLSTSPMITDLSGRGLGLAIVREEIERLGGHISLFSQVGKGCRFTLHLPVSLATYRVALLRVEQHRLALPASAVERVLRVSREALKSIENQLCVRVDQQVIPLWPLATLLGLANAPATTSSHQLIVLISGAPQAFGLLVDELLGDQEVVIQALGPQLQRVANILAATQLGDGHIVPILHPQDLYKSACLSTINAVVGAESETPPPSILVVEDSITSRSLLKMILENAGYRALTANDGLDAWTQLLQEPIDLVVSDVEMPRMNGFELTSKIRAHRQLEQLPIVLVTALSRAEDRERGLEAGANAYIVKSGFDQHNLLDVIRQLL